MNVMTIYIYVKCSGRTKHGQKRKIEKKREKKRKKREKEKKGEKREKKGEKERKN